jgi:hypothetical protein
MALAMQGYNRAPAVCAGKWAQQQVPLRQADQCARDRSDASSCAVGHSEQQDDEAELRERCRLTLEFLTAELWPGGVNALPPTLLSPAAAAAVAAIRSHAERELDSGSGCATESAATCSTAGTVETPGSLLSNSMNREDRAEAVVLSELGWRLRAAVDFVAVNFVGRHREAQLLVLAMAAGQHLLLLGPPGTAKSALVRKLAALIKDEPGALGQVGYFERLLTRFSVPVCSLWQSA